MSQWYSSTMIKFFLGLSLSVQSRLDCKGLSKQHKSPELANALTTLRNNQLQWNVDAMDKLWRST